MAETRRSRPSATSPVFILLAISALSACGGSGSTSSTPATSSATSRQAVSSSVPNQVSNAQLSTLSDQTLSYSEQGELPLLSIDQSLLPVNQRVNFGNIDPSSNTETIYTLFNTNQVSKQSVEPPSRTLL